MAVAQGDDLGPPGLLERAQLGVGDDHLGPVLGVEPHVRPHRRSELLARVVAHRVDGLRHAGCQVCHCRPHDRHEQLLLGAEVVVQRRHLQPDRLAEVAHRCAVIAALRDQRRGLPQDRGVGAGAHPTIVSPPLTERIWPVQ